MATKKKLTNKSTTAPAKKKIETTVRSEKKRPGTWISLLYVLVAAIITYILGSLAIDTGSLWHYAAAFAAVYYVGYYLVNAIRGIVSTKLQ